MELIYFPAIEDKFDGTVWVAAMTIYNAENPELEEGIFEERRFDDEQEARDLFDEFCERDDIDDIFSHEPDGYFDTIGALLYVRDYENGWRVAYDAYFTGEIVDEKSWSRF